MPSVIQNLCDPCFASDQHVEGSPHVLTIDGLERVLILCGACEDASLKPLRELLTEHGAKPAPTSTTAAPRAKRTYTPPSSEALAFGTVPLPNDLTPTAALAMLDDRRCLYGCERTFATREAVGAHLRQMHGASLTQLGIGKRGGVAVTDDASLTCSEPGCGKSFDTAQGIGAHRFRSHGIRGSSAAQQLPLSDDAPDSVVAMRERSELRDPKTGKLKCPDCERQFETLRGLGGHRSREHGYVSSDSGSVRKRRLRAEGARTA